MMSDDVKIAREISRLAKEFKASQKVMTALGDEMRQHLILIMMQSGECTGLRVGEIAEKTRLSRPAVSHHLQILKDAGIVKMRREATRNYYYFDADMEAFNQLIGMFNSQNNILELSQCRTYEEIIDKVEKMMHE